MVLVNGGGFEMGAEAGRLLEVCNTFRTGCQQSWFSSAEPIHTVQLSPFYIDIYEVTNEAYAQFLNELEDVTGGCLGQNCFTLEDSRIEQDANGRFTVPPQWASHPVTGITWFGAAAYCQQRGARLPSEAEWEMAASWNAESGAKRLYPWGDAFDGTAVNFCDESCQEAHADGQANDGFPETSPVGNYENGRSPAGAYDMGGNVWEWVNDWFVPDYYAQSPDVDPMGPEGGEEKVVRGGSWFDSGNFTSSAVRFPAPPLETGNSIGFRCAMSALPGKQILAEAVDAVKATSTPEATVEITAAATQVVETVTATPTMTPTGETVAASPASATATAVNCQSRPGIDLGDVYIVGACDWLSKIARNLGIDYRDLLAANPQITNPDIVYAGQVINLPPRAGVSGGSTPPAGSGGPPASSTPSGALNP